MTLINEFTINTKEQLLMYMIPSFKGSEVVESDFIGSGKWAWSDNLGYHFNVASGTDNRVTFVVGNMSAGDKIEVSAEVYVRNGKTPQIAFNVPNVSTIDYTLSDEPKHQGFHTITLNTENTLDGVRSVNIGNLGTSDSEGYMRNIRVKVIRKATVSPIIQIPIIINTPSVGNYQEVKTFTNNLISITPDIATNRLKLNLKKPVPELMYLRPTVTFGQMTDDDNIIWKSTAGIFDSVVIKPYKYQVVDGVFSQVAIAINSVPALTYMQLLITFSPKDYTWHSNN